MIVLNVTYHCHPGLRDAFLQSVRAEGIDAASRAEDGNAQYESFLPADGGDRLLLLEKWRDAEALSAHARQSHFARLGELKAQCVRETVIEKYVSEA